MQEEIQRLIQDSSETILKSISLSKEIEESINAIVKCIKKGKKIVLFGNGGSAADAQHVASELIGRFEKDRKSFPAIALTADSSVITSLSNDYSYDVVFSRQCESLVSRDDVVIGISTSGNSKNVEKGFIMAKKRGAITIGLLGNQGGIIKKTVDIPIIVNSRSTPRIQEAHRVIYHIICEMVERKLSNK